ncbi:hypothetical protein M9Y10_016207 [Tritrichomonas musculus]|uniref:Transposase n=1 Tax=Tritrichomonas musculus TaxID=1915356 RepID=A0ABR2I5J7_9EUKA
MGKIKFHSPHRKYHLYPKRVNRAKARYFRLLNDESMNKRKIFTIIKNEFGIPRSTMVRWSRKWKLDPFYVIAIFAPLKSMTNSKIRRLLLDNDEKIIGMKRSLYYLQESWKDLPIFTLMNAWDQYL